MVESAAPSQRAERVLVVGLGGLGCPASLALAQAGVRHFTFVDPDRVELTNLHRQPWFRTGDVGRSKVQAARSRLLAAFPEARVEALEDRVDAGNAEQRVGSHDFTVDGTDSIAAKFLLSDAAVLTGRVVVYGGVLRMEGQWMVLRPQGPCLRCLFEQPGEDDVPSCAQAGVLGSVAGVVGGLQAQAALHFWDHPRTGPEEPLCVFDAQRLVQRQVRVRRAADCVGCGADARLRLVDPEAAGC
ncbi:MAG: HesA/MoeB/ThiF family protein [Myxococcota bacterium]|nr:HesA/MoeB/ThiF family protein [Myxococcota bacterium]